MGSECHQVVHLVRDTISHLFNNRSSISVLQRQIRNTLANLLVFQRRWSTPMELPFGLGMDMSEAVEHAPDVDALTQFGVLFPCPEGEEFDAVQDMVFEVDQKRYYMVGSDVHDRLVANGKVEGEAAEMPDFSFSRWMLDLFDLLSHVYHSVETARSETRRIAGAWYFHASSTDFDPSDDEGDEEGDEEEMEIDEAEFNAQVAALRAMYQGEGSGDGEDGEEEGELDEEEARAAVLMALQEAGLTLGEDEEDEEGEAGDGVEAEGEEDGGEEDGEEDDEEDGDEMELESGHTLDPEDIARIASRGAVNQLMEFLGGEEEGEVETSEQARESCRHIMERVKSMHVVAPDPQHDRALFEKFYTRLHQEGCSDWLPIAADPLGEVRKRIGELEEGDPAELREYYERLVEAFSAPPPKPAAEWLGGLVGSIQALGDDADTDGLEEGAASSSSGK